MRHSILTMCILLISACHNHASPANKQAAPITKSEEPCLPPTCAELQIIQTADGHLIAVPVVPEKAQ
jgi:hypothetical protein